MLEIGPGLGVLTRYLAERVSFVHAVEIDPSLASPHLPRLQNVRLEVGDALRLDLADLDPPPSKLVSNLPYNVATPIVVESLDGLPSVERWCVMVQREVADRFFASPGTKAYGAVSVLVQLAAERTGFHPVSRTVFRPPPNVDSAARRVSPQADAGRLPRRQARRRGGLRPSAQDACRTRSSLAGRRRPAKDGVRGSAALGRDAIARAEVLAPGEFVRLARLRVS